MFSKGADVDALRDSAGRMASFGSEIDVVRARGQRAVGTMQRVWQGPDLQHLVERWRRVEHDLARISADFDRLSRRLNDNADLQHRSSGRPSGASGHTSGHSAGHSAGHSSGHAVGHASGPASGHAAFGQVVEPAGVGQRGGGPQASLWGAPVGATFVASAGTPHAPTAMGWAQWIGVGQAFELQHGEHGVPGAWLHPVPSAAAAAGAAYQLGLPIR